MPFPQSEFPIFRADDDTSPRRFTNDFETGIMQKIVTQVALICKTSHVERLIAISLKTDMPSDVDPQDSAATLVCHDDILFARTALRGLPQVELVEELKQEAIVVGSPDPGTKGPVSSKPPVIQLRAEVRSWVQFIPGGC